MSCEKYQAALIEAAVTGDDMPPAVRAHAAACPSCAAELAQQRSLIAAIDANLHRTMKAAVPAAMLQRLEARIAQQPQPQSTSRVVQIFAGALATLATAAMILLALPHLRAHKSSSHTAALAQTAQPIADHRPEIMTAMLQPATPEQIRRDRKRHTRPAAPLQPEVLVPPDETIAFEHFLSDLNEKTDLAAAIGKPVQEQREQRIPPLKTPDIETAALTVQPLTDATDR